MKTQAYLWLALGAVVLVGLVYLSKKAAGAIGAVGSAVNPVNDKNIFYQGASAVSSIFYGSRDSSLGSDVYNYLHPNDTASAVWAAGKPPAAANAIDAAAAGSSSLMADAVPFT